MYIILMFIFISLKNTAWPQAIGRREKEEELGCAFGESLNTVMLDLEHADWSDWDPSSVRGEVHLTLVNRAAEDWAEAEKRNEERRHSNEVLVNVGAAWLGSRWGRSTLNRLSHNSGAPVATDLLRGGGGSLANRLDMSANTKAPVHVVDAVVKRSAYRLHETTHLGIVRMNNCDPWLLLNVAWGWHVVVHGQVQPKVWRRACICTVRFALLINICNMLYKYIT